QASIAASLVLPLDQHAGVPAVPSVSVGERVLAGQPIAQPGGEVSAWLHSPVSGTVTAIEPRPAPHHSGAPGLSIVIGHDGRDDPVTHPVVRFEDLSPADLREHIARGGMVGLGGAAFPTAKKLDAATRDGELHLLLNGAECEPYISCDDMLMRERANDVVLG